MRLYHGSDHIIEKPEYNGSKKHNDYGYGFYCTEYPDMAREWSSSAERNGYLNTYDFDNSGLSILNLNELHILVWLTVLLQNRTFLLNNALAKEAYRYLTEFFNVNTEKYDVIKGYRADDSYFSFAQDFVNGAISLDQLSKAMKLGELGDQIVLKSSRSFDRIRFVEAEETNSHVWYPLRKARDDKARKDYYSVDKTGYEKGAIYITRIIDEEMKPDDERLQ